MYSFSSVSWYLEELDPWRSFSYSVSLAQKKITAKNRGSLRVLRWSFSLLEDSRRQTAHNWLSSCLESIVTSAFSCGSSRRRLGV